MGYRELLRTDESQAFLEGFSVMRVGQLITHRRDAPSETVRRFPGTGPVSLTIQWHEGLPLPQKRQVVRRYGLVLVGPRGDVENYQKIMTGDFVAFQVRLENEPTIEAVSVIPGQVAPPMFGLGMHNPSRASSVLGGLFISGVGIYLLSTSKKVLSIKGAFGVGLIIGGIEGVFGGGHDS
jgi:hypothetical protein